MRVVYVYLGTGGQSVDSKPDPQDATEIEFRQGLLVKRRQMETVVYVFMMRTTLQYTSVGIGRITSSISTDGQYSTAARACSQVGPKALLYASNTSQMD